MNTLKIVPFLVVPSIIFLPYFMSYHRIESQSEAGINIPSCKSACYVNFQAFKFRFISEANETSHQSLSFACTSEIIHNKKQLIETQLGTVFHRKPSNTFTHSLIK